MKTALKLATLTLLIVLGPRVAMADVVLARWTGQDPAVCTDGSALSTGDGADHHDSLGQPARRKQWARPRRWRSTSRTGIGGSEAIRPPVTPRAASSPACAAAPRTPPPEVAG